MADTLKVRRCRENVGRILKEFAGHPQPSLWDALGDLEHIMEMSRRMFWAKTDAGVIGLVSQDNQFFSVSALIERDAGVPCEVEELTREFGLRDAYIITCVEACQRVKPINAEEAAMAVELLKKKGHSEEFARSMVLWDWDLC